MVRASLTSLFVLALFAVAMIPGRARGAESPHVVALQEPQNPLVAFRFMFRTGSVDDPAGQEGITALAATLECAGVRHLATFNLDDFAVFKFLELVSAPDESLS